MTRNKIIIKTLIFLMATGCCVFAQAQQQKPSQRSFAAEVKKIKEKQAARNTMIRQMQQPAVSASVPVNEMNSQQVKSQDPGPATASSTVPTIHQPRSKPSSGQMRQPPRPVVHQKNSRD